MAVPVEGEDQEEGHQHLLKADTLRLGLTQSMQWQRCGGPSPAGSKGTSKAPGGTAAAKMAWPRAVPVEGEDQEEGHQQAVVGGHGPNHGQGGGWRCPVGVHAALQHAHVHKAAQAPHRVAAGCLLHTVPALCSWQWMAEGGMPLYCQGGDTSAVAQAEMPAHIDLKATWLLTQAPVSQAGQVVLREGFPS